MILIWAKTNKMTCAHRRKISLGIRSAWAFGQSDQSSLFAPRIAKASSWGQRRLWSDWANAQADLSSLGACHFVCFVVRRLKFFIYITFQIPPLMGWLPASQRNGTQTHQRRKSPSTCTARKTSDSRTDIGTPCRNTQTMTVRIYRNC